MKNKVIRVWVYVLGVLPLAVLACIYNRLPQEVPMHWNVDGSIDYSTKGQLWFVFALGLIFAVMFDILPKIDPRKENYARFGKYYDFFCVMMNVFLIIIEGITLIECFRPHTIPVGKVVMVLLSVVFLITGNIMPKMKTNFYMGIKTPWTLSNPDVWNKTHRLGGRMMFIVGFLGVISGLFTSGWISMIVMIVGVICITIIPLVMSYIWYKGLEKH